MENKIEELRNIIVLFIWSKTDRERVQHVIVVIFMDVKFVFFMPHYFVGESSGPKPNYQVAAWNIDRINMATEWHAYRYREYTSAQDEMARSHNPISTILSLAKYNPEWPTLWVGRYLSQCRTKCCKCREAGSRFSARSHTSDVCFRYRQEYSHGVFLEYTSFLFLFRPLVSKSRDGADLSLRMTK